MTPDRQPGRPALPPIPTDAHDALADARHNLAKFEAIETARRAVPRL